MAMRMHLHHCLTAGLMLVGAPAWAQSADPVEFRVSHSQQSDSNLFRLPDSANVQAVTGRASASEQIGITSLGVSFHKAISLQQFELNANLTDYRYQKFDYLNFTASQYNAAWRWSLTPRLRGRLASERSETLNNFADVLGSTLRNQRTTSSSALDAEYEIDGPWRVIAGLSQSTLTNSLPVVTGDDYSADSFSLGLRHVWASGSQAGYTFSRTSGDASSGAAAAAAVFDSRFKQVDHAVSLRWLLSGNTSADLSAAHVSRTHPQFAQRDYSGTNAAAKLTWRLSGKTVLSADWTRELAGYQATGIDYIRTNRLSIGPVWQISAKVSARLQHAMTKRDYTGRAAAGVVSRRHDSLRDTSASIDWQPHQRITLSAVLAQARRASDQAGLDYRSNQVSVSAQLTY